MKRILLIIFTLTAILVFAMYLMLKPTVILKQDIGIANGSYIKVIETAGGERTTALLGLDTPSYKLEYRDADDCLLSFISFQIEYYKVHGSKLILTNGNTYLVVFDGTVVGKLQNGIWINP